MVEPINKGLLSVRVGPIPVTNQVYGVVILPALVKVVMPSLFLVRQKNSWVDSGSGSLPSE